ncbi:HNH endonuclease [Geminocystis sp. NIES-3709]|uniref:HNH endonuclease n=1 Tax=Geminocystis sp. NIES-3709 TaxID=1617448 RepID=UPI0005FC8D8E|nr:HNH endonuclease [Geminocystis sp. NIES-3709]BAQ66883.1 hypothetical protein GM3709_3648 [Geminocystis sp. NIES-3709]
MGRYSKDWKEIAQKVKEKAGWRCQKCGLNCINRDNPIWASLTESEKAKLRLQVHHWNYLPEDNSEENLVALCSDCHLSYHRGKRGNQSIGQLSIQWD